MANSPGPIIACLLRHTQTRQLLQIARTHGPCQMDGQEIRMPRMTTDFSKETSEHRKAFLALRPRLRQLEVKYGLPPPLSWATAVFVTALSAVPDLLRHFAALAPTTC
ncbi:hypothetical protein NDU88_005470 [Pleurodeles waltl]|uniref:Uncharacterized protein n=1 Tax=Pleurodeles waltl TaxID=8319 RepID=A0AAV7WBJ2_PLEWA|nr:hypothetical protein NDU88_005470 [Pleurodeles waltl]